MKKFFFVFAIFAFSVHSSFAQDMHSRIDSLMSYYANEYNFNGVALVSSKGKIVFENAYGYRDLGKKEKHDDNSIFQVGTLTNPFTAEIIFQLVHEHKLSLDDKVKKYFPKFPKGDSITINDLMTHTSGIMDYFMFDGMMIKNDTLPMKEDSLVAILSKRKPQTIPEGHMRYSSSEYLMLGYIIEKVTKKNYSEVFRERILKPAGMNHSGFDYRGLKDSNKSTGYRHYVENEKKMIEFDSTITGASASMYSTANDLFNFHKALQSYKLLNKKTQDSMYVPEVGNYAYGWYVDTEFDKTTVLHGGQLSGYSALLQRVLSDDLCIIILQNINFPAFDNYGISHSILAAFYDKDFTMPQPIPEVPLTETELENMQENTCSLQV
jgi:CubicO group peptidase (beta-lactamase class C family)